MEYTVDYFIEKFKRIPAEQWTIGTFISLNATQRCAYGHCGSTKWFDDTAESSALFEIDSKKRLNLAFVNDKGDPRYQQDEPGQRVVACLEDLKAGRFVSIDRL